MSKLAITAFSSLLLASSVHGFVPHTSEQRTVSLQATDTSTENRPWNPLRFMQQSSKFIPTPFSQTKQRIVQPGDVLWTPSNRNEFQFAPLDDVVMGGASSSNFDNTQGVWKGQVTDANNGGFIGVRNTPYVQWDMRQCKGLELTVATTLSKPSRFKLGLRDSTEFNGIVWNKSFVLKGNGQPQKIRIPFGQTVPTKFASVIQGETFDPSNVVGVQLIYSKFEYNGAFNPEFKVGDVNLRVVEIKAY
jgi:hypothetical protein